MLNIFLIGPKIGSVMLNNISGGLKGNQEHMIRIRIAQNSISENQNTIKDNNSRIKRASIIFAQPFYFNEELSQDNPFPLEDFAAELMSESISPVISTPGGVITNMSCESLLILPSSASTAPLKKSAIR